MEKGIYFMAAPMIRLPALLVCSLALACPALAAGISRAPDLKWQWVNPSIQLGAVASVHFQDSLVGWLGGRFLHETRDGGKSWTKKWQADGSLDSISHFHFISAGTGYAVGSGGLGLRTTDSGKTWSPMKVGTSRSLFKIIFTSDTRGWIWGGGPDGQPGSAFWETKDGGDTWELCSTLSQAWYDVQFLDSGLGFAVGASGRDGAFWRSTDGGRSWTDWTGGNFKGSQGATVDPTRITSVLFLDSLLGFVTTSQTRYGYGMTYGTRDGGRKWTSQGPAGGSGSPASGLSRRDGMIYALTGYGEDFWQSKDSGNTWNKTHYGSRIISYSAPHPGLIYAWGSNTRPLMSVQGGPWVSLIPFAPGKRVKHIAPLPSGMIWVGAYDSAYKSKDNGKTWQSVGADLDGLRFTGTDDTIWALSGLPEAKSLRKSEDGGGTWKDVPFDEPWITDFYSVSGRVAWALQAGQAIRYTEDGGKTWANRSPGNLGSRALRTLYFADSLKGWAMGDRHLFRTSTGGKTWEDLGESAKWLPSNPKRIQATKDGMLWVAGDGYTMARSSDGGTTWIDRLLPISSGVQAIGFMNGHQGWFQENYDGAVHLTEDGGLTWSPIGGLGFTPTTLAFAGDTALWMGGANGELVMAPYAAVSPPIAVLPSARIRGTSREPLQVRDLLGRWIPAYRVPARLSREPFAFPSSGR